MQSVQFSTKFEFLDEIREFVGDIARAGGFGDKDIYNIHTHIDRPFTDGMARWTGEVLAGFVTAVIVLWMDWYIVNWLFKRRIFIRL